MVICEKHLKRTLIYFLRQLISNATVESKIISNLDIIIWYMDAWMYRPAVYFCWRRKCMHVAEAFVLLLVPA